MRHQAELKSTGGISPGEVGGSAYLVIQADTEKTREEQLKAWFEQLYTALKALSEDGKLHKNAAAIGTDGDEESTLEALFTNPLWEKYPETMRPHPCQLLGADVNRNVSTSCDFATGEYTRGFIVFGT